MDHLRLSKLNKNNARLAAKMGNRKMAIAYEGLAKFHENLFAKETHEAACENHLNDLMESNMKNSSARQNNAKAA